jgi:hypothetical protein
MEKSDPVNGWPQRALSLREMMMMMMIQVTTDLLEMFGYFLSF